MNNFLHAYTMFALQTKPKNHYLKKYFKPKSYCLCGLDTAKLFGRQILEALKFLHEKGIPYGKTML